MISANLGFPRIGGQRELKKALENYWHGKSSDSALRDTARTLRAQNWQWQRQAGLTHIPSNDFSLYDHVLDTACMLGTVPARYGWSGGKMELDTYFAMARGNASATAMEMTKWFDTNYHYIVPEFEPGMRFQLASTKIIDEFKEAKSLGILTRPVILGPVSFLMLGRGRDGIQPLDLLDQVIPLYREVLSNLTASGAEWVQMDEPVLALDITPHEMQALVTVYKTLASKQHPRLCLTAYFGSLADKLKALARLPVGALHLDLVRAPDQLALALDCVPDSMCLSLGLVNGRNIWKTDLTAALELIQPAIRKLGHERLMIAPSCSLLHCPVDLEQETDLRADVRARMAFARQKLDEVNVLCQAACGDRAASDSLTANRRALEKAQAGSVCNPAVQKRLAGVTPAMFQRSSPYQRRRLAQQSRYKLPLLPTTTIGSFPQTPAIRKARADFKRGGLTADAYQTLMRREIEQVIRFQEEIGLDVLVHGEPERNDMVEYFGELLEGFAFTQNGWVQSYGSRCVKPPVIFGDVARRAPITVEWIKYAQALTSRPVKGMLTGPITILQWSFVREDQPRRDTAFQIALAVRDEIADLEDAGIGMIQIDEPALREGVPLRKADHSEYFDWAIKAFRLAVSGAADSTQIHTHMCYSEFNEIMPEIAAMDADVISIEASRSDAVLLEAFSAFKYPNEIGPGVYDIHSPRVPSIAEIKAIIERILHWLRPEQVWINPDCGLKTRAWPETRAALCNMVAAARAARLALQEDA